MTVAVVAHDPLWADEARHESSHIKAALGDIALAIHHIGSTAIPGIYAKPILDFLLEVEAIEVMDAKSETMERLGYESKGEYGIPGGLT